MMRFNQRGVASAAPLRSLTGCAHDCRSEYSGRSSHWPLRRYPVCGGKCTLACHCSHSAYAQDRRSNRHSDNWIDSLTLQHFSGYIYAAKHRCSLYYILLRLMLIVHFLPFFKAKITYLKFLL